MDLTEGRIEANGLLFAYLEAGPADGPLALCLHGFPDSAWTWRHLLPELADAGYRAVAPFMRGYAPTEVPEDGRYFMGDLVRDIGALHEALGGDERAVLIGHDWGAVAAYPALAFAPERWRRAVTMSDPAARPVHERPAHELRAAEAQLVHVLLPARRWPTWWCRPTTSPSSTASGPTGRPGFASAEDLEYVKESLRPAENLAAALGYYRAMLGGAPTPPDVAAEQAAAFSPLDAARRSTCTARPTAAAGVEVADAAPRRCCRAGSRGGDRRRRRALPPAGEAQGGQRPRSSSSSSS